MFRRSIVLLTMSTLKNYIPSEIRFTQDSINCRFNNGSLIGETLDEILQGSLLVEDLPPITVFEYKYFWWSLDNRRLWVLKKVERFGMCKEIKVLCSQLCETGSDKFTTTNNGTSVMVRGNPGGYYWKENIAGMKTIKSIPISPKSKHPLVRKPKLNNINDINSLQSDQVSLSDIRYTKTYVLGKLSSGALVGHALDQLIKGEKVERNLYNLDCILYEGKLHSLQNERLWVLKKATELDILPSNQNITLCIKDVFKEDENLFHFVFKVHNEGKQLDIQSKGGQLWRKMEAGPGKTNRMQADQSGVHAQLYTRQINWDPFEGGEEEVKISISVHADSFDAHTPKQQDRSDSYIPEQNFIFRSQKPEQMDKSYSYRPKHDGSYSLYMPEPMDTSDSHTPEQNISDLHRPVRHISCQHMPELDIPYSHIHEPIDTSDSYNPEKNGSDSHRPVTRGLLQEQGSPWITRQENERQPFVTTSSIHRRQMPSSPPVRSVSSRISDSTVERPRSSWSYSVESKYPRTADKPLDNDKRGKGRKRERQCVIL